LKKCSKCGELKDITEYYQHADGKDGRFNHCKICQRELVRQWIKDNPEKSLANRRYAKTEEGQLTYWEMVDYTIDSGYGDITALDWCERELERINNNDRRDVYIVQKRINGRDRVALFEDGINYETF